MGTKSMFHLAAGTTVAITLASMVLASEVSNPVPSTPKSIETGRQLFQKYCKGCHGEDATGNGPLAPKDVHPPNLADTEWKYGATDAEIFRNIHDGIGPKFDMKSMKSRMTDTEIWSVVNYLRSISASSRR
jgi:mono/diheme cytochrome c family protein